MAGATRFNQVINRWDVSNVTTMNSVFACAIVLNQFMAYWDVSIVIDMFAMFNQPLNSWNVTNVTNMRKNMFSGATAFNMPLEV
ncbi:BspA family leucine-rich repeat surface protein [archaeon]|nr:MAG: BspA family leucine-rich repeat surface protein [archaeon]